MNKPGSRDRLGVSFVVPVHNGAEWIRETLESILAQADGGPMEIVVVDDESRDNSPAIARSLSLAGPVRVIPSAGRGAAAAINTGIHAARFPIICQIDQDVALKPGWMSLVLVEFDDPKVGAAQGYYETDPAATLYSRVMGLDLEQRYGAIPGHDTGHVCTGNSAYRADALLRVGLFDESLGYGYDNDVSYRLRAAGYRLAFVRDAKSVHRWREGLAGYFFQQYGFGYGRLDLVAKHPRRLTGDSVSPAGMMAHPLVTMVAVAGFLCAAIMAATGGPARVVFLVSAALLGGLALERLASGIAAAHRFRTPAPLLFPLLHLVRDMAWVAAILAWCVRRFVNHPSLPEHSMLPGARLPVIVERAQRAERAERAATAGSSGRGPAGERGARILCIIPAYNEADNLPAVVNELRLDCPDVDIVIIDDGSTDRTSLVTDDLDVCVIRFSERLGIGNALRAGLRYAARMGYTTAVRIDGDGQHRASDIGVLTMPILEGRADVVIGSRFTTPGGDGSGLVRVLQRLLAFSLSALTGRRVTDPTSGFCAFGRGAIRLLGEHHPTGYPEPELVLLLSRSGLTAIEQSVRRRPRLGGRTSLTPRRVAGAVARVLLAMLIVPLRRPSEEAAGE